jgi:hypothetical protein
MKNMCPKAKFSVHCLEEDIAWAYFESIHYATLFSFQRMLKQDPHAQQALETKSVKLKIIAPVKIGSFFENAIRKAIPVNLTVKKVDCAGCYYYIKGSLLLQFN